METYHFCTFPMEYERSSNGWAEKRHFLLQKFASFMGNSRQPIFIKIVNVSNLQFNGQRFEWSTTGSSYAIISQTLTNFAIDNKRKSHMASTFAYLHLTFTYFKGQGQGNEYFECECIQNFHTANITIADFISRRLRANTVRLILDRRGLSRNAKMFCRRSSPISLMDWLRLDTFPLRGRQLLSSHLLGSLDWTRACRKITVQFRICRFYRRF